MILELKLRKLGNSLGLFLPKEALARLNVKPGETLYIITTRPFVSGNTCTGFLVAVTFTCVNGLVFTGRDVAVVEETLALARGDSTESLCCRSPLPKRPPPFAESYPSEALPPLAWFEMKLLFGDRIHGASLPVYALQGNRAAG